VPTSTYHSLATIPLDQVKTYKLEIYEDNMEEGFEEYNILEEEQVTAKNQKSGHRKFLSSDGHTFRVEHDAAKKYVNFLFNREVEEPITNEIDRRVTKAAKRARQRSLMEEELNEFYMPQSMKHTTFQSTDTNIFKVERDGASKQDTIMVGGEEPVTKKAAQTACQRSAKRTTPATPAPEAAAKTGGSSDNCNSDEDEKPAAKAALAKAAPKAAEKMEDRSTGEDSSDEEETKPAAEESTAKPTDKGSDEDPGDSNDEKHAQKAAEPAAKTAKEVESSNGRPQ
jgi:hypothetical protein